MNSSQTGHENFIADVVVIGGGGAGLAAAVSAAEDGVKNILVLEKRWFCGGTSKMASGPFGAESPAQRRQAVIARKDDLFKRAMNWAHWKINPRIVRAFIDKSGETIQWLEDKGLFFEVIPHAPEDVPYTWHVSRGGGRELTGVLIEECRKLGVKTLLRTETKKILTGKKGNITGVLVRRNGKELTINTRTVIIATGGYGANSKLLKKYCPDYRDGMLYSGCIANTGDGLVLAAEAGAATEGLGALLMGGPNIRLNVVLNVGTGSNKIPVLLRNIPRDPATLWVNKNGERFIDESISLATSWAESANAVARQPDSLAYIIFDTAMLRKMTEQGFANTSGAMQGYSFRAGRGALPGLEGALQEQAKQGRLKISRSWDEIADWIGAELKILTTTIEEYNNACARGYDPTFGKDRNYLLPLRTAPYYAIEGRCEILNTMGGIKINERMEVLNKQDNPIPGLFAAGVDAGGWVADTYCVVLPGTAFGFALNSGRIAGASATSYVLEGPNRPADK